VEITLRAVPASDSLLDCIRSCAEGLTIPCMAVIVERFPGHVPDRHEIRVCVMTDPADSNVLVVHTARDAITAVRGAFARMQAWMDSIAA
jgi:hypothetical protein